MDDYESPVDLTEFKTPASDSRGHSEKLNQIRVPGQVAARLSEVVESGIWKGYYKRVTDVQRHALVRHLKWLDSISPEYVKFWDREIELMMDFLAEEERRSQHFEMFDKLDALIQSHVRRGSVQITDKGLSGDTEWINYIQSYLSRLRVRIEALDPDQPLTKIYQKEFKKKYGAIIKNMPKVRLWEGA